MDNFKNLFLGGYGAVAVQTPEELEQLKEWMSINNLFLASGEPASKLSFIDGLVYRNDSGKFEYCGINLAPKFVERVGNVRELVGEPVITNTEPVQELLSEVPDEIEMVVESITPAIINSNIKEFKKAIIPAVQKYKNIVVTQDNYKEVKKTLTDINKSSKQINDYKIDIKKQANAPAIEFENDVKEILTAYNEVVEPIKQAIKKFEDEAKEKKRSEYMAEINEMKNVAVMGEYLSRGYADKFEFDESWLNSSCTKKKMIEEANKQLVSLMDLEKRDKEIKSNNINVLKTTFANALRMANLENTSLTEQKYIDLLDDGVNVPQIIKYINADVDALSKTIVEETTKKVEEVKQQVVEETKQATIQERIQVIDPKDAKTPVVDETTGEVMGFYTEDKVVAKIQPNQAPGKIFKYVYEFEGDAGVIKTLSKIMLILSKFSPSFKFSGKMVK